MSVHPGGSASMASKPPIHVQADPRHHNRRRLIHAQPVATAESRLRRLRRRPISSCAHRLDLARFHAHWRLPRTALRRSCLNSTAAIAAAGGYSFGRQMGIGNYPNCITAAIAWHKLIVTTATGTWQILLPEGGNPPTSDTQFGTGLAARSPPTRPA